MEDPSKETKVLFTDVHDQMNLVLLFHKDE